MLSEGAADGLHQQIGQGDTVQIVVDDGVQLFPHGERGAVTGAGAGVLVALQAGDGGQRTLGEAEDLAHRVVSDGAVQAVAAALATKAIHQAGLGQHGNDALQIFFRDALPFGNGGQGELGGAVVLSQLQHDPEGVTAFGRYEHGKTSRMVVYIV